ncbi:Rossmann-fold NAD(P)-binding domain-containing protein [Nocardiopsis aegyptia]|uniref:Uncharacterized protein n=1 Tax=Nocardiopsis aegyptia TaxID=220378 RepID=A0A7Z0ETP9_9ACTN|nr:hypothetical protein [Nocardiopsis aegyptia]NYJ38077.1 hypothetical protein [Nocardiopsis aegyptia]
MYLVTDPHHPVSHLVLHTLHTRRQPTLTTCPTHPTPITAAFLTCPGPHTPTTLPYALTHHTRHIVYLATTTPPDPLEDLITRLTPTWTLLHPGPPASHALRWAPLLRTGHLPTPRTHRPCPLVHEADLADVAVAALTEPRHHTHRTYDLTGPHHLTEADQIRILAQVLALPAPTGPHRAPAHEPTTTIERLLGRPARSFRQWAADHAADLR